MPIDDLSPNLARRIAVAFARQIISPTTQDGSSQAAAVVANDGRLATAAIMAAIVEGVRWTGRETIDIGPASAPCAARAIEHLAAGGGIFLGNAGNTPHTVGLKFWAQGEPLSQGGLLDGIAALQRTDSSQAVIDRPTRTFGRLRRFSAADAYVGDLRPAYHALRPLRFVLDCGLGPVVSYLEELIRDVACRVIPCDNTHRFAEQVVASRAHFGIQISDDGENCRVVDEQGQAVETERLLARISPDFAGPVMRGEELRQQTFRRMRDSHATIAVDPSGRLWYACGRAAVPDALQTLTLLLVLLSRNDLAFSAVLDRERISV